ncbi:MAG: hypothetical protein CMQ36_07760 [Gammaproteobacteria bacterium]|nr:hypothetical protein [Gammaproteobacteria bacterium]HAO54983.1 hypothetical protein [Gammaproteobacteria bacterium]|tara:strand:+ start:730 stop:1884 length:1155 start_codon:yes stop_codon:yes gene_type:complete
MDPQDKNASTSGPLPTVATAEASIKRLRKENATLRKELESLKTSVEGASGIEWEAEMDRGIVYSDGHSSTSALSAGRLLKQLSGLSKARSEAGRIRNSSDFSYLPQPSSDIHQLEADYVRWGYCLVAEAMSISQVAAQVDRLVDQAAAERQMELEAKTDPNGSSQLVNNLVLKGQIFRNAVEFSEVAAQKGPLVDVLLTKIMGEGFGLGCAHGSIVHQGGGLQELHIDQGMMPMPYPPYPFGSLIIWCYTDFDLESGGTYVVPGSHRTASGTTSFQPSVDLLSLVDGDPGLVSICAPPGTCIITDTRVLHCGGKRLKEGTRYAMRCHYNRGFIRALHEQSSANIHVPKDVYDVLSPRMKQMMGISVYSSGQIGEQSVASLGSTS